MNLLELYCHVDDFYQQVAAHFEASLITDGKAHRRRAGELSASEIMTILIHFHQSHYRTFKAYYTEHVQKHLRAEFPRLVGYARFVQRMPRVAALLCGYLTHLFGQCTGISFIDLTFWRCKIIAGLSAQSSFWVGNPWRGRWAGVLASSCTG
jgi:hypothetical protein